MWRIIKQMPLKFKLLSIVSIIMTIIQVSIFLLFPNLISQLIGQVATYKAQIATGVTDAQIHINIIGIIQIGPFKDVPSTIKNISFIFIIAMIIGVAFGMGSSALSNYVAINTSRLLRKKLFYHTQQLNSSRINQISQSKLLINLTNDIIKIEDGIVMSLRAMILGPIFFIGGLVFALMTNLKLSISFAILIPLLLVVAGLIAIKGLPLFKKQQIATDSINLESQESINGIKVIKSYNLEENQRRKYYKASDYWTVISIKGSLIQMVAITVAMLLINITTVIIFAIAGSDGIRPDFQSTKDPVLVQQAIKDYQDFIVSVNTFIGYLWVVTNGLIMSIFVSVFVFRSQVSAKRYFQIMALENNLKTNPQDTKTIDHGSIKFQNVFFKYFSHSPKYVLEDINFEIKAGQSIGIIGPTGSGKSSIANLIAHEYDVEKGSILLDNQDVTKYNQENINSAISYIYQKPFLFSGTVLYNMKLANENTTVEEINKALKISDAYDFVYNFKDNLQHQITQGSTNLSGGQRQRLFIAQALLKNPKILIFDDSTSALDNKTDKKVRQNVKDNFKNLTTIIISQKISSIIDCDKILVLENGKVSGFDSHKNLLKTNKLYAEIYSSQGGK